MSVRFSVTFALILLPLSLLAQLTAPGSDAVRFTSYSPVPGVKDQIFFYCNPTGSPTASLNASSPHGTGPWNFSWYRWSDISSSFSVFIKTDLNVLNSSTAGLGEGGYRVIISGGYDTTLTCWIFFDTPPLADAKLANPMKNCNYVALDGTAAAAVTEFNYKDPVTALPLVMKNDVTFMWSSDPVSSIPYPSLEIDPISFSPPIEDVTYTLRVNSAGCFSESSFFYESIHVRADADADPVTGEAPLEVLFTDKSVRGDIYEWDFGDGNTSDLKDPLAHVYNKPGLYYPKLTIESNLHCIDSVKLDSVYVEPSLLAIPNAFTPDGDGYNELFMVDSKSLRYLSVEIFSQSGLKVYGFSGDGERLRSWTGWDGNINNTSIKASPGVYFYIIRALGWDDIKYDSKEYRGFLYLYR